MNRYQLEHVIRAAEGNADVRDIVVIGSQAILGTFPDAPAELLQSMDLARQGLIPWRILPSTGPQFATAR